MSRAITPLLVFLCGTAAAHGPENRPDLDWRGPVSSFDPSTATTAHADTVKLDLDIDGQTIKLFVSDGEGNPVDVGIAEAKAFITSAGKTSWCTLQPAGMNMLSGEGAFTREPATRIDISLRLPGRKPINQDFRPFR